MFILILLSMLQCLLEKKNPPFLWDKTPYGLILSEFRVS